MVGWSTRGGVKELDRGEVLSLVNLLNELAAGDNMLSECGGFV